MLGVRYYLSSLNEADHQKVYAEGRYVRESWGMAASPLPVTPVGFNMAPCLSEGFLARASLCDVAMSNHTHGGSQLQGLPAM